MNRIIDVLMGLGQLLIVIAIGFAMLTTMVSADVQVKLLNRQLVTSDNFMNASNWKALEVTYQFNESPFYAGLSYEKTGLQCVVKLADYTMLGAVAGMKFKVHKYINIYGQLGYYSVDNSAGSDMKWSEGVYYCLNLKYAFDKYGVENGDMIGGTFGVEMVYPVTSFMDIGLNLSYTSRNMKSTVYGERDAWDYKNTGARWEDSNTLNLSTFDFGLNTTFRF